MLLRNAMLADGQTRDIHIVDETIVEVGNALTTDGDTIDVDENLVLPGMIDAHVHFREPGASHKETWETGSKSAAAGGVTTVIDQPNTNPPTIDGFGYNLKERFTKHSIIDFGLNGGVTPDWDPNSLFSEPIFALGEIFLADSTGDMGIDVSLFRDALQQAQAAHIPVTVHAEDESKFDESVRRRNDADAWSAYRPAEAEIEAVEHACTIATEEKTSIHIAHTSTPEGVEIATKFEMTCEVTPHHLLLSRDDLEELGTFGRMNPPLRNENRREQLFELLVDGAIDIVATDHAPHTISEKDTSIWDAPSGVPGVETALPLLIAEAKAGSISYERVQAVTASNVADIFGIEQKGRIEPGYDADLVIFDLDNETSIQANSLHSKCGWTPFDGWTAIFPTMTILRGNVIYEDGLFHDIQGRNVQIR